MFRRKPKKPYTIGRFLADAGTLAIAAAVGSVVWTVDKITEVIN